MRWVKGALGFAAGLAAAAMLETILAVLLVAVSNTGFEPRGLGWFVFPIGAGLAASRYAMTGDLGRPNLAALASSTSARFIVAAVVSWWLIVLAYLWIAEPYGRYAPIENAFDSIRIGTTMKWLSGPPFVVAAIIAIFRFAARLPEQRPRSLEPPSS